MADLIDRQAAIDALSTSRGIIYPIRAIESLPSAQPYSNELSKTQMSLDCISRQAAIDALSTLSTITQYQTVRAAIDHAKRTIIAMPSAQPEERWIPCSERLPDEKLDVLMMFKRNMAVGHWENIWGDGNPAWGTYLADGKFSFTGIYYNDGPIAWMPLPEPWKGVMRHEGDD